MPTYLNAATSGKVYLIEDSDGIVQQVGPGISVESKYLIDTSDYPGLSLTSKDPVDQTVRSDEVLAYRFTGTTVLAGETSSEIEMAVPTAGIIRGVSVTCPTSVDFSISIRQSTGVTPPDLDEKYQVSNETSGRWSESGLEIYYVNNDTAQVGKLYMVVTNTDPAHATGAIAIELMIEG